jgi:hypothetical protein
LPSWKVTLGSIKSFDIISVIEVLLANKGLDMFISFFGFLVYIRLTNFLKRYSQSSQHFSQFLNILLYFLNGYLGWLAGIGGCEDTEPIPKLEAGIL